VILDLRFCKDAATAALRNGADAKRLNSSRICKPAGGANEISQFAPDNDKV
jgi:hypothetical protein